MTISELIAQLRTECKRLDLTTIESMDDEDIIIHALTELLNDPEDYIFLNPDKDEEEIDDD